MTLRHNVTIYSGSHFMEMRKEAKTQIVLLDDDDVVQEKERVEKVSQAIYVTNHIKSVKPSSEITSLVCSDFTLNKVNYAVNI